METDFDIRPWYMKIDQLEAEIERLRAALKPFADVADFFAKYRERKTPDQVLFSHETVERVVTITLADCQTARECLSQQLASEQKK